MPRSALLPVLLGVLLAAVPICADEPSALAEDVCRAPFTLLVPADLVRERGRMRVVAHYQSEADHVLFDLTPASVSVTLHRAGEVTALGEARLSLPPGGEVALRRRPWGLAVSEGAVTLLRAEADLPDGGRWGLMDAPAEALDEIILQPAGEIVFSDDFMRTPGEPDSWEPLSGDWRVAQLQSAKFSANAFTFVAAATGMGPALTASGHWFWEDCTVEAAVRPPEGARGYGIGLALTGAGDYHLLRFVPGLRGPGLLQIVQVRRGAEQVLAETPALAYSDEWHRLSLSANRGELTGALNGVELLRAEDPTIAPGQALLWMEGTAPVAFDDVEVYSGPRREAPPVVLSHEAQTSDPGALPFINDPYMQEWADERDQWAYGGGGVWHAGCFWGDVELSWGLTEGALRRPVELHLCVPPGDNTYYPPTDIEPGYHLALSAAADGKLAVTLRRGAEVRAEATVTPPELLGAVTLRRSGALVEALVADQVVASLTDDAPLPGGKVGLTTASARSQTSSLRIVSSNLIDSTFRVAPTDWHIASGEWGVASRWACTPRWSWFQGRDDEIAAIWSRRSFEGDLVVEFFAGNAMDQPWAPFYQHPGNLCLTLCGTDATPGTGYSLVFAGWGNSGAGIFRRGELVAYVPGFVVPDILDSLGGATGREDAHKLHNEWQRVRGERIGSTVRLVVDGRTAVSFDDPDPLPGGAVGIWTLDNTMTVARARIYYQSADGHARTPEPLSTLAPTPALSITTVQPHHIGETFDGGIGDWAPAAPDSCALALVPRSERDQDPCLLIANPSAGGSFALAVPAAGLDVTSHPVLGFEYAIPKDVHLDLFAIVAGQRYRLRLTGPEVAPPGIEELGAIPDVRADGRWRSATVDLLGLMRPFFTPGDPIRLDALEFSTAAVPEYMHAGIGGNHAGASWRLDNFFLGAPVGDRLRLRAPRDARVTCGGRPARPDPGGIGDYWLLTPGRSGVLPIRVERAGRVGADLAAFGIIVAEPEPQPAGQVAVGPASPLDCDFETDLGPVRPWGVDAQVELRRVRGAVAGNAQGGDWCLQARCTKLGGLFGVELGGTPFEATRWPVLSFDYRATDELRVDLLVEVAGSRYTVKFTDNDATWQVIGSANAVADDTWHTATVDLGAMLRQSARGLTSLPVTALAFATSAWPGNREGTLWWLDNVRLLPANETPADDTTPPTVAQVHPADGASACVRGIQVTLADAGSGISPADLRLTVNGAQYTIANKSLSFDGATGALSWTAPDGVSLGGDGDRVSCSLSAADLAGNQMAPLSWTWRLDFARDAQPPPAPVADYRPARTVDANDFERDTGGWGDFVSCQVLRQNSGGAVEPGCLALRELRSRGSNGFALIRDFGDDWREFPVVRFRYRLEGTRSADIRLTGTTFDGAKDLWTELGSFPVSGDGWHTGRLDIAQSLRRTNPTLDIHRIFLSVSVRGSDGVLIVDDYAMYSQASDQAAFAWAEPPDASGVRGYSWLLDSADDTVPPETITGRARTAEYRDLAPGHYCFHVRACDGAGNWGPPAHVPLDLIAAE